MAAGSRQQTVGKRGIGVQISGDGNTVIVYAGSTKLCLLRKHRRQAPPKTELQLLRVDLRATTLVGREGDLSALKAWLASDRLISVRCITGRAGAGKTRLALELCEHAEKSRWTAGFAQYEQFPEFVKHASEWRWNKPTLVVIDYAAVLARDLRTWLEILARPEAQTGDKKLRLLLLERHAERHLGWWADLMRTVSFSDPAPEELADPPEPVPLLSLNAVEDRRRLLAEVMRLAGQIAGIQPIPHPPLPGANAARLVPVSCTGCPASTSGLSTWFFDRRLGDDTINNEPLYLMMAGAEAIRTGASTALTLTRTDLAQRTASRERERLNRLALQWELPDKLVAHLAMCITLQGGCSAEEAQQLVTEERRAMSFPESGRAEGLVNQLSEALPMPGEVAVGAVRPDLIGEAFLLQGMLVHRSFPKLQTEIVERAWKRADGKVATTLIRTAQDYAHGDASHHSVVWLRHLLDQMDDFAALMALAAALPQDTLALRELAAVALARIEPGLAEAVVREPELWPAFVAAKNNLAGRLRDLGQREEALAVAEESAALYRELAGQQPDAFRPDLATSLNTLAIMLSDLDRREDALAVAEESAALYRELAGQRPDAFRPDLAASLNTLAVMLSNLGRREDALAVGEEAVAIRRELVAQRPDAFQPDLAISLNNLANRLGDLGRREDALAVGEEAVAIRRELVAQRPDAFQPDLADSLTTLANRLRDLGLREDALAVGEEAAALYRELAGQRPNAFRPDLAGSLTNLASMLSNLGRREEALAVAEEAVAIRRELAGQRPNAFRPDLAQSLTTLANRLSDLGLSEDALAVVQESAALYRELAGQRPEPFRPELARSLHNLASMLAALGRREPALAAAQEAVAIRRELAGQRPNAFLSDLAASLAVQANCLEALDMSSEALTATIEAIRTLSPAFIQYPAAFGHWMGPMVTQYQQLSERLGQSPDMELLGPVLSILQDRGGSG
jgi:hypothetical protein